MVDDTGSQGQTGTGEPRSARVASEEPDEAEDSLRPPDPEETRRTINRSGSGGTGGPAVDSEEYPA